jgi:hypothetical protein
LFVITDLSETSRWLSGHGLGPKVFDEGGREAWAAEGVEFVNGRLTARAASLPEIPDAIWAVASAALRLADAALFVSPEESQAARTDARRAPPFEKVVLTELFEPLQVHVEVEPALTGASGSTYRPDFYVPDQHLVIEALGTPHATAVSRAYAELGDLQRADGFNTSSLINDVSRRWPESKVELLAQVGEVFSWEHRESLATRLRDGG